MLQQRICPRGCGLLLDVSPGNGRLYAPDEPGPHWHAPIEEPIADIIECVCGSVVWRAADGTKTDTTTGEPHSHRAAVLGNQDPRSGAVVVQEQARGGATPSPQPVAPQAIKRSQPATSGEPPPRRQIRAVDFDA